MAGVQEASLGGSPISLQSACPAVVGSSWGQWRGRPGQAGPGLTSHTWPQLRAQKQLLQLQLHFPNGVTAWHLLSTLVPHTLASPREHSRLVSGVVSGCPVSPRMTFEVNSSVWRRSEDQYSAGSAPPWTLTGPVHLCLSLPHSTEAPQAGRKDEEGNREQSQRPDGASPLPQARPHHLPGLRQRV